MKQISFPEDVKKLKDAVPIIQEFSDLIVELLYSEFSVEEYCASWMLLDSGKITEFAQWLRR